MSSASRALPTIKRAESDAERPLSRNAIVGEQGDSRVTKLVGVEWFRNDAVLTRLDRLLVRLRPVADHHHLRLVQILCARWLGKHVDASVDRQHQIVHDQVQTLS